MLRSGWIERLMVPEPLLLGGLTLRILLARLDWYDTSPARVAAALAGGVLAFVGLDLLVWSWLSWRGIFFGHALTRGHQLVTTGAYGVVRHPVYVAAILIWLALGIGTLEPALLVLALAYVIPGYALYLRSEEQMMVEAFGEAYMAYRKHVPMLLPRWRGRSARDGSALTLAFDRGAQPARQLHPAWRALHCRHARSV